MHPVPAVQPWFILEKIKSNYTFIYKLSIGSSSDDMCPLRSYFVKEYWKIGSGHGMGSKLSYITRFTIPKLSANYQEYKLNRFRAKFDRNFPTWKDSWSLDKQEVEIWPTLNCLTQYILTIPKVCAKYQPEAPRSLWSLTWLRVAESMLVWTKI